MSDSARSAVKAEAVRLDPSSDACGALAVIAAAAARQLAANRSLLVDGYDAEVVHQLRVGARRLRAALKLFGRYEPAVRRPPFLPALRTLVAAAGAARDPDVLLDATLPRLAAGSDDPAAVAELARHYAGERDRARQHLLDVTDDPRTAALMIAIDGWIARLPMLESPRLAVPVTKLAPRLLDDCARRLRRKGRRLAKLTPEDRHAARIAAKELRYAGDGLASLYAADASRPWLHALAALQDVLGELNDLAVLDARLQADAPPGHTAAAARVRTLIAAAAADAHAPLAGCWRQWRALPPFWRDAG